MVMLEENGPFESVNLLLRNVNMTKDFSPEVKRPSINILVCKRFMEVMERD